MRNMTDLPYFDQMLRERNTEDSPYRSFDRYVHWGYWDNPASATRRPIEFEKAMERLDREVVNACGISDGQSVLDAGCGFGGTLATIGSHWSGLQLTGINIDGRQLEIARTRAPGVHFVEGNACSMPFGSGSFDKVLAVECIFHFPSRLGFLTEAARVLKPGGFLALSDFVPTSIPKKSNWIDRAIRRKIENGFGPSSDWSDGDYRRMAEAAGLRIVLDRDITANTLPTYPALLEILKAATTHGESADCTITPVRILKWLSKLGLLRYRILAFEKP